MPRDRGDEASGGNTSNLVGRDDELAASRDFLSALENGPATLVVEGPAGIGKTTLLETVLRDARDAGFAVLRCQPTDSESRLSFAAFGDILRPMFDDVCDALTPTERSALESVLLRGGAAAPAADTRVLGTAFLSALRALADRGAVVLAVDDAPWLDEPSARILGFAVRRLENERVGIVACIRTPSAGVLPLDLARSMSGEHAFRATLGPLSVAALQHLLRARGTADLPRQVLTRIHDASGGNPMLALEIGRAVANADSMPRAGDPLPLTGELTDVVAVRVAALRAPTRRLLLTAAASPRAPIESVLAAAGLESWQDAGGPEAEDAGIAVVDRGRIRFTHPIYEVAAYAAASNQDRRDLHRALAESCADVEQRALHLANATTVADAGVAAALDDGARAAWARGAPIAASELADAAIDLTPNGHDTTRTQRCLQAALYLIEAGDLPRATVRLEEFRASSATGPDLATALRLMARIVGEHDSMRPRALLHEALEHALPGTRLAAVIQHDLAWAYLPSGEVDSMLANAQACFETATALGDDGLISAAAAVMLTAERADHRPWRAELAECIERAPDGGTDEPLGPLPQSVIAALLLSDDELDRARAAYEAELLRVSDRGSDHDAALVLHRMADLEWRAGRFAVAMDHADAAVRIAAALNHTLLSGLALFPRARVHACLGNVEESREDAERSLAIGYETGNALCVGASTVVLGFLEASIGDAAATHARLGMIGQVQRATGLADPGMMAWIGDEVDALVALGQLDEASALTEWGGEVAARVSHRGGLARAARCRAVVSAGQGDAAGALDKATEAVRLGRQLPLPIDLGRSLIVHGQVLRRAKQKRAARDALTEAQQLFSGLGMRLWAARADAELARVGMRTASRHELTETERRVAELAARGLRNREIASELFVSERTVVTNLTRVYTKLGIRARPELTAALAAQRKDSAS